MHSIIVEYISPGELAKIYKKKSGEIGANRNNIYQLIKREIKKPGSTDIDVLELPGPTYFVKQRNNTAQALTIKKGREDLKRIELSKVILQEAKDRAEAIQDTKVMGKNKSA